MDLSLDEIAAMKKKTAAPKSKPKAAAKAKPSGGKGKGAKKGAGAEKGNGAPKRVAAMAAPYSAPKGRGRGGGMVAGSGIMNRLGGRASEGPKGTKIWVNNLAKDISSEDVAELFGTVGEVLSARVASGTGKATVVMAAQSKAIEAVKQFNNRTLDGVPMEVKLAPKDAAAPSAAPASGGKASLFGTALGGGGGGGKGAKGAKGSKGGMNTTFSIVLPASSVKAGKGNKGGKGAAASKGKGKGKGAKPKDAAALDADLDSYFKGDAAPEVAAPKAKKGAKAAKEAPKDAAALDSDLDAYFAKKDTAAE